MRFLYAMKIMEQETSWLEFLSQSDKIPPDRIKRSVTTKMSSDMKEAADTCLIVSGGPTDREFAAKFVKERSTRM